MYKTKHSERNGKNVKNWKSRREKWEDGAQDRIFVFIGTGYDQSGGAGCREVYR